MNREEILQGELDYARAQIEHLKAHINVLNGRIAGLTKKPVNEERDRRIADAYNTGKSVPDLAKEFFLAQSSIHGILVRMGVKMRRPGGRTLTGEEAKEHGKKIHEQMKAANYCYVCRAYPPYQPWHNNHEKPRKRGNG